jgi:hypothetical protein
MTDEYRGKVAILYPGDHEVRRNATPENNRFAQIFQALSNLKIYAEPAVYHDEFCEEVRQQLMLVDVVLVWMNPVQEGRDRTILDFMLREVASAGVYVSAHPDIILKMGTKEVLYRTRDMGWGCDTHLYRNMEQIRKELPIRLASGESRILKQYHGSSGDGVWKVKLGTSNSLPQPETIIRVRHAKRDSIEEQISLDEFFTRCKQYFNGNGMMIDQAYQTRLPEGMVRCYLVHDKIVGFGHQAVNALFPAPSGALPSEAPQPGPRLYHPPDMLEFQALKHKVEQEWVPAMQRLLDIKTDSLPILWDCDFLFGQRSASGEDTYVLCEINVSSVAPFPESAPPYVAEAALAKIQVNRRRDND